jgi:hypothetical protein
MEDGGAEGEGAASSLKIVATSGSGKSISKLVLAEHQGHTNHIFLVQLQVGLGQDVPVPGEGEEGQGGSTSEVLSLLLFIFVIYCYLLLFIYYYSIFVTGARFSSGCLFFSVQVCRGGARAGWGG